MLYTATLCLVNAKHTYYRIILYTTKNISDDQFSYIIVRILTWRVRIRSTLDALDALFYKFRKAFDLRLVRIAQSLGQRSNCCRSRKCIRWHIPVHAIFTVFYLFFLLVLSRPFFTSRTPNKDQKTE